MSRKTVNLTDGRSVSVFAPKNPAKFLWMWARGRFMPCKPRKVVGRNGTDARYIPLSFVDEVAKIRDMLIAHNATALLSGGSLLGTQDHAQLAVRRTHFRLVPRMLHYSAYLRLRFDDTVRGTLKFSGGGADRTNGLPTYKSRWTGSEQ